MNASYFFWAEGWDQSLNCGPVVPPTPREAPKGNATSGHHLFTVIRNGAYLEARIDGAVQHSRTWNFIIGSCWGSVNDAAWVNEVYNFGDQSGGPDANRQNWEATQYHSGSWRIQSGTSCNVNGAWAHQRCAWSTSSGKG